MGIYLKITDGSTTIDLVGNDPASKFRLLSGAWGPNVASRKRSQLGGHLFEDVAESIPLYVENAAGPADVIEDINELASLLDQAGRWSRGEDVDPVVLRYSPQSDSAYVEAAITQPIDGGVILDQNFGKNLFQNLVDRFEIRFTRRGLWLGSEETKTRTESTNYNPGIMTPASNFSTSVKIPSPTKLELTNGDDGDGDREGYILIGKTLDRMALYQAEDLGTSGPWATVADIYASGGNVKRYDPTTFASSNVIMDIDLHPDVTLMLGCVSLMNRSSDITYTIKFEQSISGGDSYETTVGPESNNPQVVALGPLKLIRRPSVTSLSFNLTITASKLGVTADSLDMDIFAFTSVSDGVGRVLTFEALGSNVVGGDTIYDHRSLTHPTPIVFDRFGGSTIRGLSDKGDPFIYSEGDTIAVLPVINTGDKWAYRHYQDGGRLNIGLSATRHQGYLVPL